MGDNLHVNHRQRMRDKYIENGADSLETHELLELLLYNSIPQKDTNDIAHVLLEKEKNNVGRVLCADCDTLCQTKGIGEKSALLLKTAVDTTLRMLTDRIGEAPLNDEYAKRMYLYIKLAARQERCTVAVLLNRQSRVICCADLARGSVWRSDDYADAVKKLVKKHSASAVILCHNHKNGDETPSVEDYFLTEEIEKAAKLEGFGFSGHYIVTDHRCIKVELQKQSERNGIKL